MASSTLSSARIDGGSASGSQQGQAGEHGEDTERARRRLVEYFRALGLTDEERLSALCEEIVADAMGGEREQGDAAVRGAVAQAQRRYARFVQALLGEDARGIDPLWLRAFVAACPEVFLGDPAAAREAALRFGDPRAGRPPAHAEFKDQHFERARLPRWLRFGLPPFLLAATATSVLVHALADGGLSVLELLWAALFAFLFGLASIGAWVALLGFASERGRSGRSAGGDATPDEHDESALRAPLPRSVLVMPIYEEDAEQVFAGLAAMRESLAATAGGEAFEIFVLSDSRRSDRAAEEERAFRRIASTGPAEIPIYYRRRTRNDRQKAGNLAEFFERYGHRYTYAVVLDADSLMHGETLVRMLRRMEASPEVALLQAPLALHGGQTLFARAQQFAASTSGPVFMRGLARWAGPHGNYYGHNAVLRVRAFLECCSLPVLAGAPPLGGHILSHDFVEAALLCRAGWEVRLSPEWGGSFEELPPTFPDYVARDRRWCQGNLQHLRIVLAEGLLPMSRLHMLIGAASYLAGPAWLAFVTLSAVLARGASGAFLASRVALPLMLLTLIVLIGPRVLGVLSCLLDPRRRAAHGGAVPLLASAGAELVVAGLLAPLLMVHHTRIVVSIVLGASVRWSTQKRRAEGALSRIVRSEGPATVLGLLGASALAREAPELLAWLAPVWLPASLAIALAYVASSAGAGRALCRLRLLLVPSEVEQDELLGRASDLRALTSTDESARFRDIVLDPLLLQAHLARSASSRASRDAPAISPDARARLRERALRVGPAGLDKSERELLLSDAESMRFLHEHAWQRWPVESWQLGRERPQLPPEPAQ